MGRSKGTRGIRPALGLRFDGDRVRNWAIKEDMRQGDVQTPSNEGAAGRYQWLRWFSKE